MTIKAFAAPPLGATFAAPPLGATFAAPQLGATFAAMSWTQADWDDLHDPITWAEPNGDAARPGGQAGIPTQNGLLRVELPGIDVSSSGIDGSARLLSRRIRLLTAGVCAIAVLSACSGAGHQPSTPAPRTGAASTSPSSPASISPTAAPTPSVTKVPAGKTQSFTIRRGALPKGMNGEAAAAAEAWLVYWEYLAVADSIPAIDPTTVGSVMTGAAATKATNYVARLKKAKTHVIGTVGVNITSSRVHGSAATVCGSILMSAFEFDAKGRPAESIRPVVDFFKGTAQKTGPKWRISDYVNLQKPC